MEPLSASSYKHPLSLVAKVGQQVEVLCPCHLSPTVSPINDGERHTGRERWRWLKGIMENKIKGTGTMRGENKVNIKTKGDGKGCHIDCKRKKLRGGTGRFKTGVSTEGNS